MFLVENADFEMGGGESEEREKDPGSVTKKNYEKDTGKREK